MERRNEKEGRKLKENLLFGAQQVSFLEFHGVEDTSLLGEVAGVFLTLVLSLLGVGFVGGGEVAGAATGFELHDALNDVAEAEVAGLDALLHDPRPGLLVGLEVGAVAHLFHKVHHGAELRLAFSDGTAGLGLAFVDLAEDGVVGGEIRGAVGKVHFDHEFTGIIVGLDAFDLLDPGGSVGVDFVTEEIVLLGTGEADLAEGGGGESLVDGGAESAAHSSEGVFVLNWFFKRNFKNDTVLFIYKKLEH